MLLETSFKNVFASLEGDAPDFLQVLDIANEGYQQKEIHVLFECETKVYIYQLQPRKLRKFTVFKLTEKFKMDKSAIGL